MVIVWILNMDFPEHEVMVLPNSYLDIQDRALFTFNKQRDRAMTQRQE